jgi:hypothetical protein
VSPLAAALNEDCTLLEEHVVAVIVAACAVAALTSQIATSSWSGGMSRPRMRRANPRASSIARRKCRSR